MNGDDCPGGSINGRLLKRYYFWVFSADFIIIVYIVLLLFYCKCVLISHLQSGARSEGYNSGDGGWLVWNCQVSFISLLVLKSCQFWSNFSQSLVKSAVNKYVQSFCFVSSNNDSIAQWMKALSDSPRDLPFLASPWSHHPHWSQC